MINVSKSKRCRKAHKRLNKANSAYIENKRKRAIFWEYWLAAEEAQQLRGGE